MKRFMYLSISVTCLAVVVLFGHYFVCKQVEAQTNGQFQWTIGINNGVSLHYIMLSDGNVYGNYALETQPLQLEPSINIGNFWGSEGQAVQGAEYHVRMAGSNIVNHFVILPNGEIYGRTTDVMTPFTTAPPIYIGNLLDGLIATDQSTWGSIKGQFNKGK